MTHVAQALSEEQCRLAVEAAPVAILMVRRDGRIVYVNREAEQLFGYAREELHNLAVEVLVPERFRAGHPARRDEYFASSKTRTIDAGRYLYGLRKGGGEIPIEIGLNPISSADGDFVLVSAIAVTERLRADEMRRELAAVIESSDDAIISKDLNGIVRSWNRGAERIFGYSAEEVVGRSTMMLFPQDRVHEEEKLLQRLRQGERVDHFETVRVRKDGEKIHVSVTLSLIRDARGQIVGTSRIARDISGRKQAEHALQQAKTAAEKANRSKSEFLANMSHEIRTPMNGILGMTRLALETELNSTQREYLQMSYRCAESLLEIINDILDFSKIEAGKLSLEVATFSVRDCVQNVMNDMSLRADDKGLELTCEFEHDICDTLVGDSGRLRQVLINLLGNAIKFTDAGDVSLSVRTISTSSEEIELLFSVRDTGMGIPSTKIETIFDAFAQVDASTTRLHSGTGLGLTISAKLVSLMGGQLDVESEVGVGSTFRFSARFGWSEQPPERPSARSPLDLRDLPVLIVDDNSTNRRILCDTLTHWQMRPHAVSSGSEALQAMREGSFDDRPFELVLLDAMMPVMDGFAVAEALRSNRVYDGATIMMLSSADHLDGTARCQSLGVQACLTKPVNPSALLNAMVDALSLSQPSSSLPQHNSQDSVSRLSHVSTTTDNDLDPTRTTHRSLQILLAEDNIINQKVAIGMLEGMGHRVSAVNNGNEALAVFDRQLFDLVLMDLQMPEKDGFETTAEIRASEGEDGAHIPIIALTAHAMKGDRERCLAAGMDEYVSKPIEPAEMATAIENCLHPSIDTTDASLRGSTTARSPFDKDELWERLGHNTTLMSEILSLFPAEAARLMDEIETAFRQQDAIQIQWTAHTLKGSLASICAGDAYEAARHVEESASRKDLQAIEAPLCALAKQIRRLNQAIAEVDSRPSNSNDRARLPTASCRLEHGSR